MKLSLRYLIRFSSEFLKRFKGIILVGIVIGISVFTFFNFVFPQISFQKNERVGVIGKYRTESLPDSILQLVGNGLTTLDKSGIAEPSIAKSWETPDKGATWIFEIDSTIKWQDQSPVEGGDIKYNFSDVTIDSPSKDTVIFKLKNPYSPFPIISSKPVFKKGLLGTGEWIVKDLEIRSNFVQKIILKNKKGLSKTFKFYPTEDRAKLALKLGQIDVLEDVYHPSPFEKWRNIKITKSINYNKIVTLFFNTQDPFLGEKTVRQAIIYAINKDGLNPERAISPLSPDSWAYNPQVKTYDYSVEKAKKTIQDLPSELKGDLKLSIVTSPTLLSSAEKISNDLKNAGFDNQILVSSTIPVDFQMFLAIFEVPQDPDQYTLWHSTQTATNISRYKSPRIDKLLEDGRVELDQEARKKIYLDFQRFIVEDSPAAFLYHPTTYRIERK